MTQRECFDRESDVAVGDETGGRSSQDEVGTPQERRRRVNTSDRGSGARLRRAGNSGPVEKVREWVG